MTLFFYVRILVLATITKALQLTPTVGHKLGNKNTAFSVHIFTKVNATNIAYECTNENNFRNLMATFILLNEYS